jgi:hypothetical protein
VFGVVRKRRQLLRVEVRSEEDAKCLMRELADYSPNRSRRTVRFEFDERPDQILDVVKALETCLSANEIPAACVELDGHSYMLVPSVVACAGNAAGSELPAQ